MKSVIRNKFVIATLLAFAAFPLTAEEGIYLPDLTTIVEDSSEVFVPEVEVKVSQTVTVPAGTVETEVIVPEVAEVPVEPEPEPEKVLSGVDGVVGAGWPGNIFVELNLCSQNTPDSYYLSLLYDTQKSFKKDDFAKGFYDRTFSLGAGKVFHWNDNKNLLKLNGTFLDAETGLQGFEESSSYTRTVYLGKASYIGYLPKGFELSAGLEGGLYNRSLERKDDSLYGGISPELRMLWHYKDFQTSLYGNYDFEKGNGNTYHRGYTGAEMLWQNRYVMLLGDVGAVFGNNIGNQKVLVPFTVNTIFCFPIGISETDMVIGLEGGMSSEGRKVSALEKDNLFTAVNAFGDDGLTHKEVSDWYGNLAVFFPIKDFFGLKVDVEYRKTAFGNAYIQPDYENLSACGLYGFEAKDRQLIHSTENVILDFGNLNMAFGWNSNFDFVPSTEDEQAVFAFAEYDGGKWDVSGKMEFPVLSRDSTPVLDLESSIELKEGVRIALNIEDTVKLFNGKRRLCTGRYASRSGSASLMVKFTF